MKTGFLKKIEYKVRGMVTLKPKGPSKGTVLLAYMCEPFFYKKEALPLRHTNYWECYQIAQTFLDLGYAVDVIDWQNTSFIPRKPYSAFVDIHDNIQRLAPLLPKECAKIYHITGAHWIFCIAAEYGRLADLKDRRGIVLIPRRVVPPDFSAEHMDAGTVLGNAFTQDTYTYAHKPLYHVPISTTHTYPFPEQKDFEAAKKNFVWFGGGGMVHKGLDLVLEVFAALPEYNLTIVGPVNREDDFEKAFYKELYETPNIKTIGWLDPASKEFTAVTNDSAFLIYPSSSEGGGGSVVNMMHAGVVPIVSYESSVDVSPFGTVLKESTLAEIKNAVTTMAHLPASEVRTRAEQAWTYAREHHTKENFARAYRDAVIKILGDKQA